MSSKKNLKKDIECITSEFISDCFLTINLSSNTAQEKVEEIANKVLDARDNLVYMLHHPENKGKRFLNKNTEEKKERMKKFQKTIKTEFAHFIKLIEDSYSELSNT